jgi:carbamate kinase
MRIVVALGGNAIAPREGAQDFEGQVERVRVAASRIAALARHHQLVVTHGNGPQVGWLAAQSAAVPLDVAGAETEGMIGYWIEREVGNLLPDHELATLLTQVEVDPADPAFDEPTKPIGPVLGVSDADALARERGWTFVDADGGRRRVVPSPRPRALLEERTLRLLVRLGVLVVCGGGGGIPVVADERGWHRGVEAVIDKDLAAELIARRLDADLLLMLTDVPGVFDDWPEPARRLIRFAPPRRLRERTFEAGTMGPKIEAAYRFARQPGRRAAIGALEDAERIVAGDAGTEVSAEHGDVRIEDAPG